MPGEPWGRCPPQRRSSVAGIPQDGRGRRSGDGRTSGCVRHDRASCNAPISEFLSDRSSPESAVSTALLGIKEIAARHPECRAECVGILVRMLEPQAKTDPVIGGFAVLALIDLEAVEAIDVIRDAFRRDAVDISVVGDVEDVEIALGLRARRATPAPKYMVLPAGNIPWLEADRVQQSTPASPRSAKVGRNDPCPCGSGKKYKKCCLQ
jgi:hypothetical protein